MANPQGGKSAEPKATILSFSRKRDRCRTVLRLNWTPGPPLAPASIYPEDSPTEAVLDLHKLVRSWWGRVTFDTVRPPDVTLRRGEVYTFRCWWAPWQLALAQDTARNWEHRIFAPADAFAAPATPTGKGMVLRKMKPGEQPREGEWVIPGGWDHEHCGLCWKKISSEWEGDRSGYTDGKDWICQECYEKYIASGFGRQLG